MYYSFLDSKKQKQNWKEELIKINREFNELERKWYSR